MFVINLDEYEDAGTHWIALYVKNKKVVYFDSFGVEHVPKEIIKFIKNKDIIANKKNDKIIKDIIINQKI